MTAATILTWQNLSSEQRRVASPDAVFFAASNTQVFESDSERAAFREFWLGQYLDAFPELACVAVDTGGVCVGYCVIWPTSPHDCDQFTSLEYFAFAADAIDRFPAHLHINLAEAARGQGLGSRLLMVALSRLEAYHPGHGTHVFTEATARNRQFYRRNGFDEIASVVWRDRRLVMMGRGPARA